MVFLAPVPTFYQIYKKKSTEGFQSIPYVVALLSAMLWIYYALAKREHSFLLLTINTFGVGVESLYIAIFLVCASHKARLSTIKLLVLCNVFGFGGMVVSTLYLTKASERISIIGWVCLVFNIGVFASPLGIIKKVIETRSVAFMPLSLSFFLSLNAIMWFFYGFLLNDYYIALPNTLGFLFGIVQMVIYLIYKNSNEVDPKKLQELNGHIIDIVKMGTNTMVISGPNQVANSGDENPNNGK
ncbi:bidirectional sugar transporter SWEET10 isoform X2 [Cicer arietinum]|nr:bidirectional sugar transporter SWEET10 isoform X2 [Cicer arietinum]